MVDCMLLGLAPNSIMPLLLGVIFGFGRVNETESKC